MDCMFIMQEVEYHGALSSSPFSHPQAVAILSLYNGKQFLEKLDGEKITTTDVSILCLTAKLMTSSVPLVYFCRPDVDQVTCSS